VRPSLEAGSTVLVESIDCSTASGVRNEGIELLSHSLLRESHLDIELGLELLSKGLGGVVVELNLAKADGLHHTLGGLEALVVSGEFATSGQAVHIEGRSSSEVGLGSGGVLSRDGTVVNGLLDSVFESVDTVVVEHTLEVRLVADLRSHLVGVDHVFLLDDLRGKFSKSFELGTEGSAALLGGGVHTEDESTSLVSVAERVELELTLLLVLVVSEHVATMTVPGGLGDFVEEETAGESLSVLFPTHPLEDVWLLTGLTDVLHGGPLGSQVVHGVVPSLTRISIEVPAVSLVGLSPVGDSETLEESSGVTVETDITDTLKHGVRVEMLGIEMVHNIGLLVEFVAVHILDAHANFTCFFHMESVGNKEEVRMNELHELGYNLLDLVARGEDELNPSLEALFPDVMFESILTNAAFSKITAVDHPVQE